MHWMNSANQGMFSGLTRGGCDSTSLLEVRLAKQPCLHWPCRILIMLDNLGEPAPGTTGLFPRGLAIVSQVLDTIQTGHIDADGSWMGKWESVVPIALCPSKTSNSWVKRVIGVISLFSVNCSAVGNYGHKFYVIPEKTCATLMPCCLILDSRHSLVALTILCRYDMLFMWSRHYIIWDRKSVV